MRFKPLSLLGVALLCAICGLVVWRLWPLPERETQAPAKGNAPASPHPPELNESSRKTKTFDTPFTLERLSQEHERAPTPEEWKELTRILLHAPDGDMVESVKARFAVHAGSQELAMLEDAYDAPVNDDTRQRVLEVFASLQSADFMDAARRILNDEALPITDHLVNACAVSLARHGEQQDAAAIFQRLNAAGEDPEPEGSLYSEADGLVGAIGVLQNPALERFLMDAAAGRGVATTNRARAAAAVALRSYHSVPVTEVLYKLSKNEPDPLVRRRAAESLQAIQTPE